MNFDILIDNIVRQTTVLVAQLATAAGGRAPLAHVTGQVFLSLVGELKDQGLGNKVIADMFGLALRTYHNRVRRYSESATDRGVTLWEAVLDHVKKHGTVGRAAVLRRFHRDDEEVVRSVLRDLVESGLVFRSGRGDGTAFRAADAADMSATAAGNPQLAATNLIWVALHQRGLTSAAELVTQLGLPSNVVGSALDALVAEGRARVHDAIGAQEGATVHEGPAQTLAPPGAAETAPMYEVDHCVIPYGDEHGWEAALFDHYQAVVTAIASKVRCGAMRARRDESTGGSTYHFDLCEGHPLEEEVLGFLADVRRRASELRQRVIAQGELQGGQDYRVVFYAGQNVIGRESYLEGVES